MKLKTNGSWVVRLLLALCVAVFNCVLGVLLRCVWPCLRSYKCKRLSRREMPKRGFYFLANAEKLCYTLKNVFLGEENPYLDRNKRKKNTQEGRLSDQELLDLLAHDPQAVTEAVAEKIRALNEKYRIDT